MPQGKDDEKLVAMTVKVPAHIRFGFRDLAVIMGVGETELMTQFVEDQYKKRHGHSSLPRLKRDYFHTRDAILSTEYDPAPDELGDESGTESPQAKLPEPTPSG